MPDYSQPPAESDLQAALGSLYDAAWNLNLQGALDFGLDAFERDTNFKPFWCRSLGEEEETGANETTRRFTAPGPTRREGIHGGGRLLQLGGGLLALSSLTVDSGSGSIEQAEDADFWLEPANAPAEGWPFTLVRFDRMVYSLRNGIAVTGLWGFCGGGVSDWPATAWQAVLGAAMLHLAPDIAARKLSEASGAAQGAKKAKQVGSIRIEYATLDPTKTSAIDVQIDGWIRQYAGYSRFRLPEV
jgi:hypothetical protein